MQYFGKKIDFNIKTKSQDEIYLYCDAVDQ